MAASSNDNKSPRANTRDIIKANNDLAAKLALLEALLLEHATKEGADSAREALPEIFSFAYDYFAAEDYKMRLLGATGNLREALDAHTEDHADMMARLRESLDLPVAERQMQSVASIIRRWRCEHLPNHDNWLFQNVAK